MHAPTVLATMAFTALLSALPTAHAAAINVTQTPALAHANTNVVLPTPSSSSTSANAAQDTVPAAFPSSTSAIVIPDARPALNKTGSSAGPAWTYPPNRSSWLGNYGVSCISNYGLQRCVDVDQSSVTDESADAQMWTYNRKEEAQGMSVLVDLNDHWHGRAYRIIRTWNHKYCLDVPGGHAFEGQIVRWWECNDSDAQEWHSYADEFGHLVFSIKGHEMKLCLDPAGGFGNKVDGQQLQLWRCHGGHEQRWLYADFDTVREGMGACSYMRLMP